MSENFERISLMFLTIKRFVLACIFLVVLSISLHRKLFSILVYSGGFHSFLFHVRSLSSSATADGCSAWTFTTIIGTNNLPNLLQGLHVLFGHSLCFTDGFLFQGFLTSIYGRTSIVFSITLATEVCASESVGFSHLPSVNYFGPDHIKVSWSPSKFLVKDEWEHQITLCSLLSVCVER